MVLVRDDSGGGDRVNGGRGSNEWLQWLRKSGGKGAKALEHSINTNYGQERSMEE